MVWPPCQKVRYGPDLKHDAMDRRHGSISNSWSSSQEVGLHHNYCVLDSQAREKLQKKMANSLCRARPRRDVEKIESNVM